MSPYFPPPVAEGRMLKQLELCRCPLIFERRRQWSRGTSFVNRRRGFKHLTTTALPMDCCYSKKGS